MKTLRQGKLGILSLDTAFDRICGDAGNPDSYPFDCLINVVPRADSSVIVADKPPCDALLSAFINGAQHLEKQGAQAIVSTCGFLVLAQRAIADAVRVPVMMSALSLVPLIYAIRPGPVGILTASATSLGPNVQAQAGIGPGDAVIAGLDGQAIFRTCFLVPKSQQPARFDINAMRRIVVEEATRLVATRPDLSAVVLECGNLPPYADDIRRATGRPVYSIIEAAEFLMRGTALAE